MKVALTKQAIWLCCLHEQGDLCWGELGSRGTNEIQCCKARKKQELSHKLTIMWRVFLLVLLFVFINCFVPSYHWQITFIMLNRFCLLRETSHPLLLMVIIKLDGIPSKIKWRFHVSFTLYFKSYRYFLKKVLFCLVVLHELLHQQILFLTTFFNFI